MAMQREESPSPSTPYERMRWQQEHCKEDIIGYAVGIASEQTRRAAYMLPIDKREDSWLTNDERAAAILSKEEATKLMLALSESDNWFYRECWNGAFLVPVSEVYPLARCTFQGH